ncbi:solute carrier family 35 member G2-like [Branchiostoma lanceolatum]|uniref:solute carrier family 35 member G2-like n=1 Tax=Branchiostoma lanceolatum TaxID=7740 RepID=UPI0034559A12
MGLDAIGRPLVRMLGNRIEHASPHNCPTMKCYGKGLFSAIAAAVGYTVAALLSRRVAEAGVPAVQLVAVNEISATVAFIPLAVIFCCRDGTYTHDGPWYRYSWRTLVQLLSCGLIRVVCTSCLLVSALLIPPGNTFAIGRGAISPLVTLLVAWKLIKESPGRVVLVGVGVRIAAIGLIVAGGVPEERTSDKSMALLSDNTTRTSSYSIDISQVDNATSCANTTFPANCGTFHSTNTTSTTPASLQTPYIIGNVLAFIGPIGFCFVNVMYRSLLQRLPRTTCLAFAEGMGSVFLVPIMYALVTPKWRLESDVALYLAGQGLTWVSAAYCLSISLLEEKAIVVEMLQGAAIALAFLLQYLIFDIRPSVLELIGACVIVFTIVLVSVVTWRKAMKKDRIKEILKTDGVEGKEEVKDEAATKMLNGKDISCQPSSVERETYV